MNNITIHQFVHGYDRGHEQLSGSLALPPKVSELVTRLSDLSGQLHQDAEVAPYLTGYPIRSISAYALAMTWPDNETVRAGCVLTHTLLIPQSTWGSCDSPECFGQLFSRPRRETLASFNVAITLEPETLPTASKYCDVDSNRGCEFVEKYFCEGFKPIVWFGVLTPEACVYKILRAVWPALRNEMSFCTYSLQPRNLGDDPFHLLYAPESVYSRFHKIPRQNMISLSSVPSSNRNEKSSEPWCNRWARSLFAGDRYNSALDSAYAAFAMQLRAEPTEIRKLYLIETLYNQLQNSPSVIVGLLDIIENLAPTGEQAKEFKNDVVMKVLRFQSGEDANSEYCHALAILGKRLSTAPYASLSPTVRSAFIDTVVRTTHRNPERLLQALQDTGQEIADNSESLFACAVAKGLDQLSDSTLPNLERFPELAPHLISNNAELAVRYLLASSNQSTAFTTRLQSLSGWITRIDSDAKKQKLRISLLPLLNRPSTDLLVEQLLQGIEEDNVNECLDVLLNKSFEDMASHFKQAIVTHLSQRYPNAVKTWASTVLTWHPWCAIVAAGCYEGDEHGLDTLLKDTVLLGGHSNEVLAAYILSFSDQLPCWFRQALTSDAATVARLIRSAETSSGLVMEALGKVLYQVTETPLAGYPDLASHISRVSKSHIGPRVVSLAMASAIRGFVSGTVKRETCEEWASTEWGTIWLVNASINDLWGPLGLGSNDPRNVDQALLWIAQAPETLYSRSNAILADLMARLRPTKNWNSVRTQVDSWRRIIKRALANSPKRVHLRLCEDALTFAFRHKELPVSPLVIAAFTPVYNVVTRSDDHPNVFAEILGYVGWDKGKELRKLLIESFMESAWPPGDIALAVEDEMLRKRIIHRMGRGPDGEKYISLIVRDLEKRTDETARRMAPEIRRMFQERHNWSSWD